MAGKRRAEGAASTRTADMSWPELLRARLGRPPKKSKADRGPMTWKRRLLGFAKWSVVSVVVLALIAVAGFVFLYKTTDIPDPNDEFLTNASVVYYDGGKEELGRYAIQNRDSIPLEDMPDNIKQAVVAAEDQTFYSNNGIDTKGILRAVFNNAAGGSTQGASTITQQYVKILYLNQERSYKRKVKEAILSLKIQREYDKDEVLEGYLNTIYFGRGAYGIQAAADVWFEKPAKDLDLREAAVLASVLNDPNDLDPDDGKDARRALKGRYQYVLDSMAKVGDITEDEAAKAAKKLPAFPEQAAESTYGGQKGHMLKLVKDQLLGMTKSDGTPFTEEEIDGGGLRITTTLDPRIMKSIEQGVQEIRPTEGEGFEPKKLHVGVATVEPGTGALRGFYGGQDYLDSQINWAVSGGQAGSTFKPFAVAAGIKDGYSLRDTFDGNSPYEAVDGSEFENQGDDDYGTVSLLQATEDSINTAFIDLTIAMDDGPEKIIKTAEAMGIPPAKTPRKKPYGIPKFTDGLKPETGVALGSQTVSPINMANGYATIAAEGMAAPVHVVKQVTNRNGDVLYRHKVAEKRALDADIAADVSYAMQQVVVSGSGSTNAPLPDGRPAAGKTGTATKDGGAVSSSWFAGFTPQLATAVVYVRGIGNGQLDGWLPTSSDGLEGYFGGNYPAKTWNAIMSRELAGVPIEEFPEPAYVDGDAPDEGHSPVYVPPVDDGDEPYEPPPPTRQPPRTPTQEPTQQPTELPTEEPTVEPSAPPTSDDPCGLLGCPSSPPPSSPPPPPPPPPSTPAPSPQPGAQGRAPSRAQARARA